MVGSIGFLTLLLDFYLNELSFLNQKLVCEILNLKKYFITIY